MTYNGFQAGERTANDLICFSHLRWSWVYQRPQHLMTRAARDRRVFVYEEAVDGAARPDLVITRPARNIQVATPHLPAGLTQPERLDLLRELLDIWISREGIRDFTAWYYTPMALPFSAHLEPECTVYDCMDELAAFAGAPTEMSALERQLFSRCDIVFAGGHSLHEAKRRFHSEVYAVPSSVDTEHFARARSHRREAEEQASLPRPRLGYCGVIDERLDLELIDTVARERPDWQLVFVGPVTKIDPASLPQHPNIRYLGGRAYEELPRYLAGWDVALLPFALNESTRYISPTKTPEYLAAGLRVASTSVRDVVRTFGDTGFVEFGDGAEAFIGAIERCVQNTDAKWLARVDSYLATISWDRTWARMQALMTRTMSAGPARGAVRPYYHGIGPSARTAATRVSAP